MSDIDESIYRLTVAQRDAAWREVEHWKRSHNALLRLMMDQAALQANPPITIVNLPHEESYEAGRIRGAREEREACAELCDQLDLEGVTLGGEPAPAYGRDCAAAIRKRGQA